MNLIKYMFTVSIISSLALWFCVSDNFVGIQNYLLGKNVFSIFIGHRSIVIGLLSNICVTAWFAMGGFVIDYFNKKKKTEDNIMNMYHQIRNHCYDSIMFENDFYVKNFNATYSTLEYLNKNLSIIFGYQRPLLKIIVKLHKLKRKIHKSNQENVSYFDEDIYALILRVYNDLLEYFFALHTIQANISENEKIIKLCINKIEELEKQNIKHSKYNTHLQIAETELKKNQEKLYLVKLNKKDLYNKFYAIDFKNSNDLCIKPYTCEIIFSDEIMGIK